MASSLYTTFKDALMSQNPSVDLDTDTIKARLFSTDDYTFNAGHDFIDDVTAYSGTTDQTLSNKAISSGNFDNTADLTFSSVAIDGNSFKGTLNGRLGQCIQMGDLADTVKLIACLEENEVPAL